MKFLHSHHVVLSCFTKIFTLTKVTCFLDLYYNISLQDHKLSGSSVTNNFAHCHLFIIDCRKLKKYDWVVSSHVTLIPSFVKISHVVQIPKCGGGDTRTWYGDSISLLPFLRNGKQAKVAVKVLNMLV
jgi:hypothetical protein